MGRERRRSRYWNALLAICLNRLRKKSFAGGIFDPAAEAAVLLGCCGATESRALSKRPALLAGSGGGLGPSFCDGGGGGFVGAGVRCSGRLGCGVGSELLFIEVADDAGDVGFGFEVGRDASVLLDALRSGVIGGEALIKSKS